MWCRFLTFCVLVSFILIIVLNYLHDRPVVKLFFKRCCDDGIENDQVVFETFSNNYLKERLISVDIVFDNGTFVPQDVDIDEVIEELREKLNVHDPAARKKIREESNGIEDFGVMDDNEEVLEVETVNVLEISEIENKSNNTKTTDSNISVKETPSDSVTKDDYEITTEKPDNDTITVT